MRVSPLLNCLPLKFWRTSVKKIEHVSPQDTDTLRGCVYDGMYPVSLYPLSHHPVTASTERRFHADGTPKTATQLSRRQKARYTVQQSAAQATQDRGKWREKRTKTRNDTTMQNDTISWEHCTGHQRFSHEARVTTWRGSTKRVALQTAQEPTLPQCCAEISEPERLSQDFHQVDKQPPQRQNAFTRGYTTAQGSRALVFNLVQLWPTPTSSTTCHKSHSCDRRTLLYIQSPSSKTYLHTM